MKSSALLDIHRLWKHTYDTDKRNRQIYKEAFQFKILIGSSCGLVLKDIYEAKKKKQGTTKKNINNEIEEMKKTHQKITSLNEEGMNAYGGDYFETIAFELNGKTFRTRLGDVYTSHLKQREQEIQNQIRELEFFVGALNGVRDEILKIHTIEKQSSIEMLKPDSFNFAEPLEVQMASVTWKHPAAVQKFARGYVNENTYKDAARGLDIVDSG